MREMRERISAQDFRPAEGSLTFSVRQIELVVPPDGRAEGDFEIAGNGAGIPEGFVRSADERMECLTPWFCGNAERIAFRFDAGRMQDGETRSGRFFIVSNYGEYELCWKVQVKEKPAVCSLGEIENLFQFTNLARARWQEAVKFFYSAHFLRLCRQDSQLVQLYRGLSACYGNENNVEEFLVAAQKKQPVSFAALPKEIRLTDIRENCSEELSLQKIGWGPVRLAVEARGEFLSVEKSLLTENDFLGSQCRLPLYFHEEKMHGGNNLGEVVLRWHRGSLKIPVIAVKRGASDTASGRRRRELQGCQYRMVKLYQDFRMKKLEAGEWRDQAYACVRRMIELSPEKSIAPRLFYAQLLLTEDKAEEASWVLRRLQDWLDEAPPAVYCYYLYLTTLYDPQEDYVRRTTLEIEKIFSENPREWRIAWLILFLSRQLGRSAARKWSFLEAQFSGGCISPVLYLEALQLLNACPTLLTGLDSVAGRLLLYGAKNGILGKDLMVHVLYLTGREKYFDPTLYRILTLYWDRTRDSETLQAICTLLIKGGRSGQEYYPWYLRGVEEKFRITRLYEYYMMSLDPKEEVEIPRSVQIYFAYQSNLDHEFAACLYAYMEKHREEDPELYITYRPQMEQFVTDQLKKGRISLHLAYLYRSLLKGPLFTPENACALASLLCVEEVSLKREETKLVVVPYRQQEERAYPVRDQKSLVRICSRMDMLFTEDENRNRFCVQGEAVRKPLFDREQDDLFERVGPYAQGALSYHLCAIGDGAVTVTEKTVDHCRRIAESTGLRREFLQEIDLGLLRYDQKQGQEERSYGLLSAMADGDIGEPYRAEAVGYLVQAGLYEKAYRWLKGLDLAMIEEKILMRLCSALLQQQTLEQEERLTQLCFQTALRGKYDEHILRHLADHYEGSVAEMEAVKAAAEGFEIDTFSLCQRIMEQMLYTGQDVTERMDLLRQFVAGGGRSETEIAFLRCCARRYVIAGQLIHVYMIQCILRLDRAGEPVGDLCRIACLKYFANRTDPVEPEVKKAICRIGTQMRREGKILPVLKAYAGLVPGAELLLDRTFVTYMGDPGDRLLLNYRILQPAETDREYQTVPFGHVCEGIFCAQFLLFAGETLQYYISSAQDPSDILDSGLLKAQESGQREGSRYAMLNALSAAALDGGGLWQGQELMRQYLYTDYCVDRLFTIQE